MKKLYKPRSLDPSIISRKGPNTSFRTICWFVRWRIDFGNIRSRETRQSVLDFSCEMKPPVAATPPQTLAEVGTILSTLHILVTRPQGSLQEGPITFYIWGRKKLNNLPKATKQSGQSQNLPVVLLTIACLGDQRARTTDSGDSLEAEPIGLCGWIWEREESKMPAECLAWYMEWVALPFTEQRCMEDGDMVSFGHADIEMTV